MAKKGFREKYIGKILSGKNIKELGSFVPYGISTQSLCLDMAIGCPGIPGGRMTQIYGLDGCGKSSLCCHLLAEVQRMGGQAVLFDTEDCYDLERAKRMGVNLNQLDLLEPDDLEEMLDMLGDYTSDFYGDHEKDTPLLFIVDSMEGVMPRSMQEAGADDKFVGAAARLLGAHIPKILKNICREHKATLVIVSQQYDKVGGTSWHGVQEKEVKGGRTIKYRASLRLEIKARQGQTNQIIDATGSIMGYRNEMKIWKNKSAAPFVEADYWLTFDKGIDKYRDVYEAAVELGALNPGGGGVVKGKIGKLEVEFRGKDNWPQYCDEYGGVDKFRRLLTRKAIRLNYIRDYGIEPETETDKE